MPSFLTKGSMHRVAVFPISYYMTQDIAENKTAVQIRHHAYAHLQGTDALIFRTAIRTF